MTRPRTTYRELNLPTMRTLTRALDRATREGTLEAEWISWASKWHQVIYNMRGLIPTERTWLRRSEPIIRQYRPKALDTGIYPGQGVGHCGEPIYIIDGWADHCLWTSHLCNKRSHVFHRGGSYWCVTCNSWAPKETLRD